MNQPKPTPIKDQPAEEMPRSGFLTPIWVRRRYSISNSTLYSWCASGILPPLHRIGPRAVRFRAEDIRRFEEERMARGVKPAEPQQ